MMRLMLKTMACVAITSAMLACKKKEETPAPVSPPQTKTFTNLFAPQTGGMGAPVGGAFKRFSFAKGDTVTDANWDLAFRGTTIIVNGGAKIGLTDEPERTGNAAVSILADVFENVKTAPADAASFKQDGANNYAIPSGSGNGWYNYSATTNIITPIAGKVFVVRTFDGKYAKVEFLSYYKDAPASPTATSASRYYTFRYTYQPNGTSF